MSRRAGFGGIGFVATSIALLSSLAVGAVAVGDTWQELRADHFIVYYQQPHQQVASTIGNHAERYYQTLARGLGYARYDNFWQWENRVKIYLYSDQDSYLAATGRPEWSQGMADYSRKIISSYVGGQDFSDTVLPHEIGHLIFRDFVGFKGEIPLWLDEGVAQWAEQKKKAERRVIMRALVAQEMYLPLSRLMQMNAQSLREQSLITVPETFSARDESGQMVTVEKFSPVALYYLQAFSLVDFLVERGAGESFVVFCRQLRDGKQIEAALSFAYPNHIRSLADFERQWLAYLRR